MSEISLRTSGAVTYTTVASSATSVELLAANPQRRKLIIQNTSTAILYVDFTGGTATSTTAHSIQLASNANYTIDNYTGPVSGIWATANGSANLTEFV